MRKDEIFDLTLLRVFFSYNNLTGELTILNRDSKYFRLKSTYKMFNTRFGGKVVTRKDNKGYLRAHYLNKDLKVHKICWYLFYGEWPSLQIDHINGNKSDNRINNLRLATNQENCSNRFGNKNNKLNVLGVHQLKSGNYRVNIYHKGIKYDLGVFNLLEDAKKAYSEKSKELRGEFHNG